MMSVELDDIEKVLAQRNRRTRAKASEKVGRGFEYQLFCRQALLVPDLWSGSIEDACPREICL